MQKQQALLIGIILGISLFFIATGHAATINANSCSQTDVQAAINSAVTDDTVVVPSGSCTWTTSVSIPSSKKITLQGAGMNSTFISGSAVNLNQSGSRVTGFSFTNGVIHVDGDGWRIDHCKLSFSSWTDGISVRGNRPSQHPTGLIDNCILNNMRILVIGDANLLAHTLWSQPLGLGTNNAAFVEDCVFNGVSGTINAIDTNYGGRYVFRYNTLNDIYVEAHSVQGPHRATRSWEIYNNIFNQGNRAMWVPLFLRGGTGVVFNNTLTGTWSNPNIALDNVRSCDSVGEAGKCDGTSPWDGNEAGEAGYPCRDQIGRSTDQWSWTAENPYPPQANEPAYAWNNKHGANDVIFFQHGCAESVAHIQPGRDYFNNAQKPGYTPYTYPHPLRAPSPPQNLTITD